VINANTEILERENGPSEQLSSINRQVKQMTALVKELGGLAIYSEETGISANINLSDLLSMLLDASADRFAAAEIELSAEIIPGVMLAADDVAMRKLFSELIENTLKFGKTNAVVSLRQKEGHTVLTFSNGTDLSDGAAQQAFDRFTRLPNAEGVPGAGLGLAFVKDVVRAMDGRVEAESANGVFTLRIRF
jgi:signal transduction histidine kinase